MNLLKVLFLVLIEFKVWALNTYVILLIRLEYYSIDVDEVGDSNEILQQWVPRNKSRCLITLSILS